MYKIRQNGYVLNKITGEYFNEDSWLWDEYQDWISQGNSPEPEYTLPELREEKIREVQVEKNKRIDSIAGDDRQKRSDLRSYVTFNKKKIEGDFLTPEEQAKKNQLDQALFDISQIEKAAGQEISWIENPSRTMQELEDYDSKSW